MGPDGGWLHGSYVHVLPIHFGRGVAAPGPVGMQPLRVYVEHDEREEPILYVDSQPVSWDDFEAALKPRLAARPPDWPVYVEGDPDLQWRSVVQTIDKIRGAGGHAVLIKRGQ